MKIGTGGKSETQKDKKWMEYRQRMVYNQQYYENEDPQHDKI